jgi:hypothetical protein
MVSPGVPIGVWDLVPGGLPTTTVPLNGSRPGSLVDSRYTSPPVAGETAGRKTTGHASTLTPAKSSTTTATTSDVRPGDQRVRRSGTIGTGAVGSSSERTPSPSLQRLRSPNQKESNSTEKIEKGPVSDLSALLGTCDVH